MPHHCKKRRYRITAKVTSGLSKVTCSIIGSKIIRRTRGRTIGDGTLILTPAPPEKKDSAYRKQKARIGFRRRAAIEPIFGHTKQDHRMARNYLKRLVGDEIYALLTASAFNFRRWLRIVELLPNFLSQ